MLTTLILLLITVGYAGYWNGGTDLIDHDTSTYIALAKYIQQNDKLTNRPIPAYLFRYASHYMLGYQPIQFQLFLASLVPFFQLTASISINNSDFTHNWPGLPLITRLITNGDNTRPQSGSLSLLLLVMMVKL